MERKLFNKKPSLLKSKFTKFVITGALGWFVYLIGSIGDNVLSGSLLGEDALAAVEVVLPFYSLISFVSILVSTGCSIKYSFAVGENNHKRAHQIFGLGSAISLIFGIVVAILMFSCKNIFLGCFNLSDSVYAYASDYYNWFIYLSVLYPIYALIYLVVGADGDTIFPLLADIFQTVVNFALSYILCSKTGDINGLGIGTLAGVGCSFFFIALHFFRKSNSIKLGFKFSFKDIKEMFKFGAGTAVAEFCIALLDIIMNIWICRRFGDGYLTVYSVINLCINFTSLFLAVTDSVGPFISANAGARNGDDIKYIMKMAKKITLIFTLSCTALISGLCWLLPALYGITTENYYNLAIFSALIIPLSFVFYGYAYLVSTFYSSQGNPKYSVISQSLVEFILPLILCTSLSLIPELGFIGLSIGFSLTPIIAYGILVIIIKKEKGELYKIEDYHEEQFSFDLFLNKENIIQVRDQIKNKLEELHVSNKTILKTMGCVEDTLMMILHENKNKRVSNRITICVGEKIIRIINKDDGILFDLKNFSTEDDNIKYNYYLYNITRKKEKYFKNGIMMSFNNNLITLKNETE